VEPQHIEAEWIGSNFAVVLFSQSNPPLLKDESRILVFPVLGVQFAVTFL